MTRLPDLTYRLLLAAMASGLLPAGSNDDGSAPLEPVSLRAHAEPASLRPAYALPVVELPGLPPTRQHGELRQMPGCPVQVKAIVVSDDSQLSFAVVATGTESTVLHPGDGASVGNSFVAATDIQPGGVTLRRGRATYNCQLAAGLSPPGPAASRVAPSSFGSSLSIPEVTPR